ncbi:glycosyltransferase [Methylocaldum sp.]|uniref:glycosyltransferase n=1 Tax=Methylocaldum sp. TaxID=1969727 RepID=UPI002D341600|nr:glycosyltransferase [Methylocaldum sp.]HYE37880.1 glycosyltransferase [Methylocaldum sp.]
MRILYASERPPYPFFLGGAARCAHQLLHKLAVEPDVQCAAVGSSEYAVTPWTFPAPAEHDALGVKSAHSDGQAGEVDCGYPVQVFPRFLDELNEFIDTFKPDVVWAQLEGAQQVLELARDKGVQGLYYVHDAEFDPAELKAIAQLGCHVVCGSGFLADKARRAIGRPTHVVYPAAELYFDTVGDPDGYVTMINPHRVKGVETFFEIAKRLPSERFLLLESWKLNDEALADLEQKLAQVPNVRFMRRTSDMRAVYRQTKLLLVPSVWEEGFGMVAVEAQSCRIPVIASARGGLPESVGDGGMLIKDYRNPEVWIKAIQGVLSDPVSYQNYANRAYRHASSGNFSSSDGARRLMAVCGSKVRLPNVLSRSMYAARERVGRLPVLGRWFR